MAIDIILAHTPEQFKNVRQLVEEYTTWLGVDLHFQDHQAEIDNLQIKYAPPEGAMFVAMDSAEPAGCCGFVRFGSDGACELKRLYVRPSSRGLGLAADLVQRVINKAQMSGYKLILLDTLPSMTGAVTLYKKCEFTEIAPYYNNPVPNAVFYEKKLR
ncbi:GNAT family N-acetyltransferase [Aurantimonas sp. HBX-1]|uniref:GNAT family N-acetyltransferase n=1 Tax=Aurantimonas sp. HBX-1 TaxID=2906072 RepID=UPI001F30F62E|nr:GNAT family N-acetyltransferase [Aurantimonas sp. HBX-1]UIJ72644.1 GNAT family N-acetyltransferase [Aurantimonas sp. HBX-1]